MPTACLGQEISQGSTFSAKELEADSAPGQKESFVQANGQSNHTALPKVSSAPNKGECRRESCAWVLPPLALRAACPFWHSAALHTAPGKVLVGLSEHEGRWESLKPGIEVRSALSTERQQKNRSGRLFCNDCTH